MNKRPKHILISGGGTGGHIFPAIAIADGLKNRLPDARILFVGAQGRMEMQRVPEAGYPIEGLWISGIQRSLSASNLSFPIKLASSLLKARKIVRQFRPDLAVGVGGYASGPLLWAATSAGVPALIQEQNAFPGITNRLLASRVERICVAFEGMEKWFPAEKLILTGNPLRPAAIDIAGKRGEALRFFQLGEEQPVVLVTGGSQGARSINESILEGLDALRNAGIQLLWQCGEAFYPKAKALLENRNMNGISLQPFIRRMDLAYAAATLVVARAGAMTVAELAATGKAAIFVPLPTAAEDHQTRNAMQLAEAGAAIVQPDSTARANLVNEIIALAQNEDKQNLMAKNIRKFARTDATDRIVEEAIKLMS
ncbi:MAG: undecaprenyldiphospho-muramoylpentapeptide beta-N-acetylglucosaminyltransferase [Bacteroidetes bacterium]|nr:undecaprenyldiphospho-muramoylpentapeptide beta-N-acetylglucosaminyltransferase [Bacteroidota bacterium]